MQISMVLLGMGWVLLGLFLLSGTYYKKLTGASDAPFLSPIAWEDHLQVFKGAVSCSLSSEELQERKADLRKLVMSKVDRKEVQANAYVFYFKDDPELLKHLMEFVQKEKACCPFFKFDLSILPFEKGMALQISGSDEAIEMVKDMEASD
ncbi:MAG: hypothetical protein KTR30_17900 [Saprospiraceae bacterium]|nr:hypothetical protein [Saprospiraceae bacterium]